MDRIAVEKKKADALIADAKKIAANPEQAAQAWKDRVLKDDLRERLQREKTDREVNIEREELAERAVEVQRKLSRGGMTRAEHARLVAEVDALKVALQRNRGDVEVDHEANPKLSVLVHRWARENKASSRAENEWRRVFERLIAVIGADVPVRSVTKAHIRELKEKLLASAADGGNGRKLKRGTVRKGLSGLKSVFNWSVQQGFIDHNPCDGVAKLPRASVEDMEKSRVPYSAADLLILFSTATLDYFKAPMPAGDKRRGIEPGPTWRNGRGWLGYLGLLTGCRLAELTGL